MNIRSSILIPLTLLVAGALAPHAHAVTFDFSDSTQYTLNFQRTWLETGSSGAFGFSSNALAHTSTGSGSAVIAYDTTPDGTINNTFGNVSVSFDFSAATSNISFGIYFGGSSRTSAALALFNLNTNATLNGAGTNETVRFFTGGNLTNGGAGTQFGTTTTLTDGAFTTGTTYHANLTISYVTATTANVTYTITDSQNPLTSISATATGITVASTGEIGFRSGFSTGGAGSNIIDNISITPSAVPEPSTFALLGGFGSLGFALSRRRR